MAPNFRLPKIWAEHHDEEDEDNRLRTSSYNCRFVSILILCAGEIMALEIGKVELQKPELEQVVIVSGVRTP
ncbi:MAG: hypothetical protein ABI383_13850, partial [Acidobacteriaceae bacterium]